MRHVAARRGDVVAVTAPAGVVLAYLPDDDLLDNVRALGRQVGRVYVVDNSPVGRDSAVVAAVGAEHDVVVLPQGGNRGVAAGFNAGLRAAFADGYDPVCIFDQDSTVTTGMIDALIDHLLGRAGGQARCMLLHVALGNDPAVRLYRRHGFQPTVRAPFPNRAGVIEIEMMRPLPA